MKIYTKGGDHGETQLLGAKRVTKASSRIHAYGSLDELNCFIGLAVAQIQNELQGTPQTQSFQKMEPVSRLKNIQREIFKLSSLLACSDPDQFHRLEKLQPQIVNHLEHWIDQMQEELPPLKNFILPGGTLVSAQLHVCRSQCRRSERTLVALKSRLGKKPAANPVRAEKDQQAIEQLLESLTSGIVFLNRLSDFFFVCARWHLHKAGFEDEIW